MSNTYISEHFLLSTPLAIDLYHDYAASLPIIDYHNHLEAKEIWEDHCATNLAQAWLDKDHYVWRAMRWNGIDEHWITGAASDQEKFQKWTECMPYLLGNPLYQWSHLELKRFFNCSKTLSQHTGQAIWSECQPQFNDKQVSTRKVLKQCNVTTLCTTDSPCSDLRYHIHLQQDHCSTQVLPTFRADELFAIDDPQAIEQTIAQLETCEQTKIATLDDYLSVIQKRVAFFHSTGCRLADLGLPLVTFAQCSKQQAERCFDLLRRGGDLTSEQVIQLKSFLFTYLGKLYHHNEWAMQLHIGVLPNVNARRKAALGREQVSV